MVTFFNAGTQSDPGIFTTADTITVEAGAIVFGSVGGALELQGQGVSAQNYKLTIIGMVSGYSAASNVPSGIWFSSGAGVHRISVMQTGSVYGEDGGIYLNSGHLLEVLTNSGTISTDSSNTAAIFADSGGNTNWENIGFIMGQNSYAIHFTKGGIHTITNSGIIETLSASGIAINSDDADAIENITNTGTIRGGLQLGGGGDTVNTVVGAILHHVFLGSGNDYFNGSNGVVGDVVFGEGDDDIIVGNGGDDTLNGGDGDDSIDGGGGDDILIGGNNGLNGDFLDYSNATGGVSVDLAITTAQATGGSGSDTISGFEILKGSEFADVLSGNSGINGLYGGAGNDILDGGLDAVADFLSGSGGNDTYIVGTADIIEEADVNGSLLDRVRATENFTLVADDHIEIMEAFTPSDATALNLTGNDLAQSISGNAGINSLTGLGGSDTLFGGFDGVVDRLIGGADSDIYIVRSGDVITEIVGGGTADRVRAQETFRLASLNHIEIMETANVALTTALNLTGNAFGQSITGNDGVNLLSGLGGADRLNGGKGNDLLNGGTGNDSFVFNSVLSSANNHDNIYGFVSNAGGQNDVIRLENSGAGVFSTLAVGTLNAAFFKANAAGRAMDANDRIIYETDTGKLFYDADGGNGSAATSANAIHFATLIGHPVVNNLDFVVI